MQPATQPVPMHTRPHNQNPDPPKDAERQTSSLAALAFAVALLVAGLFLVQTLRRGAMVEDCLMAGRINCDRLVQR